MEAFDIPFNLATFVQKKNIHQQHKPERKFYKRCVFANLYLIIPMPIYMWGLYIKDAVEKSQE
jgi:hypothetical protein